MKKRGKLFCIMLSLILVISMMPGMAYAEDEEMPEEDIQVEEPVILQGFVTDDNGTSYYDQEGNKVTGWQTMEEKKYHFDEDGLMSEGVVKIDGSYYYFNPDKKSESHGVMETGWKKYDGHRFYFSTKKEGKALAGWQNLGEERYYFSETDGYALTGWNTIGDYRYYFNSSGAMYKGWHKIGDYTYYFSSTGKMQKKKMISKNKYVNSKGHLVKKANIYKYQVRGLSGLEKKLRKKVKGYRGTWCIYVKNLDTNRYMVINSKRLYPASLIKLYNMGLTYERIKQGKMKKTKTVKSRLRSMITVSSNDSFNYLLKRNGGGKYSTGINRVNSFCKRHGYKSTTTRGTLAPTVYSGYHKGTAGTSVRDCGHILEDMYRGTLVSESASKEMISYLKNQKRRWKIPAGLPKGVKCANKTGEVPGMEHDAAIVYSKDADYIIVVMTKGDGNAISHIRSVSKTVYNYFN